MPTPKRKYSFACLLYCKECGAPLQAGSPLGAGFERAATELCWVCAHLGKAAARDEAGVLQQQPA